MRFHPCGRSTFASAWCSTSMNMKHSSPRHCKESSCSLWPSAVFSESAVHTCTTVVSLSIATSSASLQADPRVWLAHLRQRLVQHLHEHEVPQPAHVAALPLPEDVSDAADVHVSLRQLEPAAQPAVLLQRSEALLQAREGRAGRQEERMSRSTLECNVYTALRECACQPACLCACLSARMPACVRVCVPAYLLPVCLHVCVPACLPACIPAYLRACLPACLSIPPVPPC